MLDGAGYLGVGPVFASRTKDFDDLAGLGHVRLGRPRRSGLPWFAIGGIDEDNLDEVLAAGARRVAVGSAVVRADVPPQGRRRPPSPARRGGRLTGHQAARRFRIAARPRNPARPIPTSARVGGAGTAAVGVVEAAMIAKAGSAESEAIDQGPGPPPVSSR